MKIIIPPAAKAPAKAKILMGLIVPKIIGDAPMICAQTAPRVAPLEIPMIPGSARLFLKYIWKAAPLEASKAPVRVASKVRGNLIEKITVWAKLEVFVKASFIWEKARC